MFKLLLLVLSIGALQYTSAVCNECHELNGIACKSDTEFHPCINGIPDTTQTFSCLEPEHICTSKAPICISKAENPQVKPACGDTSKCGVCTAVDNGKYTCTSRTSFTMCFDGDLSNIRVTCPDRQICDIAKANAGENPCVPSCREAEIEICDLSHPIDEPVTTTQAPMTTTIISTIPTTTTEEIPTPTTITTTKEPIITTTIGEITTTTIFAPTPTSETTTTELPTITTVPPPTATDNPANLVCSQQTAVGRYPYPNDTTCKNYIYCYRKGGQMQTTVMRCPGALYFNSSTRLCGAAKPEGCI